VNALISPDSRRPLAIDTSGTGQLVSMEGGSPQPARGLTPGDTPIGWVSDNRSVLVAVGKRVPARLEKVDLQTGARTLVREIAPPDRAGLVDLSVTDVLSDGTGYAYFATRFTSTLFVVQWVKEALAARIGVGTDYDLHSKR
jgi:hypothetical protein